MIFFSGGIADVATRFSDYDSYFAPFLRTARNVVLTIAKVGGPAARPILALIVSNPSPQSIPIIPDVPRLVAASGVAMIAVVWTNDAWYCVT